MLSKKSSRIFRSIDDFMTLEKLDEIKRENKKTGQKSKNPVIFEKYLMKKEEITKTCKFEFRISDEMVKNLILSFFEVQRRNDKLKIHE